MLLRTAFPAQLSPQFCPCLLDRHARVALLTSLLLISLLFTGCKSASTPTQAQTQPPSQSAASDTEQAPGQNSSTSAPASESGSAASEARSDDEMIGDVDAEFDASIAVFDGMILDERAKAEAIEASLGGGGDAGATAGGSGEGGDGSLFEDGDIYEGLPGYGEFPEDVDDSEADGDSQQASNEVPGDNAESTEGASQPSGPETTQRGGIPEDITGGRDDDIVARQIREAALKEKDPVLREKLWDEYRKYKNQQ